jgi:aryl sulfotransferase
MIAQQTQPRPYKDWFMESARWNHYRPRESDVVVATYPKCGTTWMQRIVSLLIFQSPEPRPITEDAPWIDCRFMKPIEEVIDFIEGQRHRRSLKSHLPFDALPRYDRVRYIHVARDGRDSCMSLFNHMSAFTPMAYQAVDDASRDMDTPVPRCPADPQTFWRDWLTKGARECATDGYPLMSFFDFESTYWQARHAENLLLVHYNDLKADLDGEMRRIAAFLGIESQSEVWPRLVEAATFRSMKVDGDALLGEKIGALFEGGADRFLYKGTNGRWRDVMSADDLALYDVAASRMTPGLARWIEGGRLVAGDPQASPE